VVGAGSWLTSRAGASIVGLDAVWMAVAPPAWGQCNWGGGTGTCTTMGSVGIGTTIPANPLEISAPAPTIKLTATGATGQTYLQLFDTSTPAASFSLGASSPWPFIMNGLTGRPLVLQSASGNVGIGTTNPQYLLSVKGTVGAEEVIVTNTGWSDYVFQPGYRLQPLSEVSAYIEANRHLPDIPSETEVQEKGVSVGEMQAKLLAKVEELTLHLIRQEKENQELRERIARLEQGAAGAMAAK
jgi:hypothetical protein